MNPLATRSVRPSILQRTQTRPDARPFRLELARADSTSHDIALTEWFWVLDGTSVAYSGKIVRSLLILATECSPGVPNDLIVATRHDDAVISAGIWGWAMLTYWPSAAGVLEGHGGRTRAGCSRATKGC